MADLQPNDEFLINRNDVTYTQPQDTLMANLESNDYLLINRSDKTYKITGQELIDSVIDPLELEVVLDDVTPSPDETINAIASPSGGKQPYTPITYQWKKRDQALDITDIPGETNSSLLVTAGLESYSLACEATVGDSLGNSVTTLSEFTNPVTYKEQVDTPELLTPPDGAGMGLGVKPESGLIISAETEGPNADMKGLRFDRARQTRLSRSPNSVTDTYTISAWVKRTKDEAHILNQRLSFDPAENDERFELVVKPPRIIFNVRKGSQIIWEQATELNRWYHVVASCTPGAQKLYVDGTEVATGTFANVDTHPNYIISCGCISTPTGFNSELDGYLSDVYFVDGQVLEPETFGADFEGKWGPLDSSDVYANVRKVQSPSDTCPNYAEKWSDSLKSYNSSDALIGFQTPATSAFDGDFNTQAQAEYGDGNYMVFTYNGTDSVTSLRVYTRASGNNPENYDVFDIAGADGNYESRKSDLTNGGGWNTVTDVPSDLKFLRFGLSSASLKTALIAVEINGRILIDGPADNSQVWSSETNGIDKPERVFNGETETDQNSKSSVIFADSEGVFNFTYDVVSKIELLVRGFNEKAKVYVGDTYLTEIDTQLSDFSWVTINYSGQINKSTPLKLVNEQLNLAFPIKGMKVDDVPLIDACPVWNTSQVWSDGTSSPETIDPVKPLTLGFDGNKTTWCAVESPATTYIDVDLNETVSTVSVVYNSTSNSVAGIPDVIYTVDGTAYDKDSSEVAVTTVATDTDKSTLTLSGNLTKIRIGGTGGARAGFYYIEVDGEILVDGGSFGANGFHLPFDPAATGANYSKDLKNVLSTSSAVYGFDGSFNTNVEASTVSADLEWNGTLTNVNTLEIRLRKTTTSQTWNADTTITGVGINGSPTIPASKTKEFVSIPLNSTTVSNIVIKNQADMTVSLCAIRVNGEILVDHNNIGVDASGQDNHFHDQNFAVAGNTDEVWSNSLTTPGGWISSTRTAKNVFDGNSTTSACTKQKEGEITFTANLNNVSTLGFVIDLPTNITVTGNLGSKSYALGADLTGAAYTLVSIPSDEIQSIIGNNISQIVLKASSSTNNTYLKSIEVDGVPLIDANIQDTVLDTPMKNYAVLETGSNGNLVGAGDPTIQGEAGTTYYYEADGVAQTQEGPISGLTAATYNFGQQPFADVGPQDDEQTLFETLPTTATLQIADAGTLDLIEGNPTMTASVGGAKGTYVSHTDSELVLSDVSGTWEVASEKAVSDVEYSVAAINPNDFVMTSSAFEALPLETTHGSSTWQVTEVNDYLYANPAINVTSSSALESLTTGGLEEDTVYRARVKHTSTNGVDSLWSEQRHQNVFKTEKLPVTVPTADMNGLRFDGTDRSTLLSRTSNAGNQTTFTYSAWVKPIGKLARIIDSGKDNTFNSADTYVSLFVNAAGGIYVECRPALAATTIPTALAQNTWHHIVLSVTPTSLTVYANGKNVFSNSGNYLSLTNIVYSYVGNSPIPSLNGDGYLSDVYFVDGHALEPTAFGALFPDDPSEPNRRWGPLDSTVVIDNINNYEPTPPAGESWNTSQVWSETVTATGTYAISNINNGFDGDVNTKIINAPHSSPVDAFQTITFATAFTNVTSVRCWGYNGDTGGTTPVKYRINSEPYQDSTNPDNFGFDWQDMSPQLANTGNTVSSISVQWSGGTANDSRAGFRAIEINGELLVDGGSFGTNGFHLPFDPAATGANYSSKATTDLPLAGSNSVASVFDGTVGIPNGISTDTGPNGTYTFELVSSFTDVTKLEIWGSASSTTGQLPKTVNVYVDNGGGYGSAFNIAHVSPVDGKHDASGALNGTNVEKIKIEWILGASDTNFSGIYINGKLLVDHNSIGTDASGQDNHFQDQNFALSFTLDNADGGLPIRNTSDPYGKNEEAGFRQDDDAAFLELALPFNGTLDDVSADIKGSGTNKVSTSVPTDYEYTSDTKYYSQNIRNLPSKMIKYPAVALEGADWTIEFWVKFDEIGDHPDKNNLVIFGSSNVAGNPYVGVETDGRILIGWYTNPDRFNYHGSVGAIEAGKWYHLAFVKHGLNLYGYINGKRDLYETNVNNFTLTSGEIAIGTNPGDPTRGQTKTWCDLRLYVGLAKYTSEFAIVELNQSQDTVLDTPMKNYAVLETGANGNLEANSSTLTTVSAVAVSPGKKIYAEFNVTGSNTGVSQNYTLGVSNSSATNQDNISGDGFVWKEGTQSITPEAGFTYGSGDLMALAWDFDANTLVYYKNGAVVYTMTDISPNNTVFRVGKNNFSSEKIICNFGQQPFVYDPPAGYTGLYQTWDQYATFGAFFYNENTDEIIQAYTLQRRYGLLGAKPEAGIYDLAVQPNFTVAAYVKEDNVYVPIEDPAPRIAAAEAQAAAEVAAAQAETAKYQQMLIRAACAWVLGKAYTAGDIVIFNGHVFRALTDNTATADNDPGDLTTNWEYLGLEEDAAPLVIDGYFPLYRTEEAANAAGDGTSHTHVFDSVTYYMPNGVTIYHGDYTGFNY